MAFENWSLKREHIPGGLTQTTIIREGQAHRPEVDVQGIDAFQHVVEEYLVTAAGIVSGLPAPIGPMRSSFPPGVGASIETLQAFFDGYLRNPDGTARADDLELGLADKPQTSVKRERMGR